MGLDSEAVPHSCQYCESIFVRSNGEDVLLTPEHASLGAADGCLFFQLLLDSSPASNVLSYIVSASLKAEEINHCSPGRVHRLYLSIQTVPCSRLYSSVNIYFYTRQGTYMRLSYTQNMLNRSIDDPAARYFTSRPYVKSLERRQNGR